MVTEARSTVMAMAIGSVPAIAPIGFYLVNGLCRDAATNKGPRIE